jgi:hypothetical protein
MIKTGYYDSSPSYSGSGYNGAWGVYPYFPSGVIAISDIENGLVLVQPNYVQACYVEGNITDEITSAALFGVSVSITADPSSTVSTDITGHYITGTLNPGTYTLTFSKSGYVTKTISGVTLTSGGTVTLNVSLESITASCVAPTTLYETGVSASSATLNWNNVGATNYTVTYRKTSGGTSTNVTVTDNMTTITGLTSCTAYKWKVKAKCPDGSKPVSVWKTFNTSGIGCRIFSNAISGNKGENNVLILYPNPVMDVLTAEFPVSANAIIKISDMNGQIVLQETPGSDGDFIDINIQDLAPGMYMLTIYDGNALSSATFMKN